MAGFKFYHYDPSFAAAVIFIALFTLATGRHLQLLVKNRSWYFIPFILGCLFEAGGYVGRAIGAKETPGWTLNPYMLQSLLTLLAPTLFAAAIYMILGRLIRLLGADSYSMIRTKWLTKVFLLGDVLSFFCQCGGGGILATADSESSMNLGNNVILLGLAIQVVFFGFFIVVTVVFHLRINRRPTQKSHAISGAWKKLIWVLYACSLLIMVRSVFRMIEYAEGNDGVLLQNEVYVYVLDATLMFLVTVLLAWCHPSEVLRQHVPLDSDSEALNAMDSYPHPRDTRY